MVLELGPADEWKVEYLLKLNTKKICEMIDEKCISKEAVEILQSIENIEDWRLTYLESCTQKWKIKMLAKVETEEKAKYISDVTHEYIGKLILQANETWKYPAIADAPTQQAAKIMSKVKNEWQLTFIQDCKYSNQEWRLDLLGKVDNEEQAKYIFTASLQCIALLIFNTKENWKWKPLSEVQSIWAANVILKVKYQWQAKIVQIREANKMEKWRIEQVPEIENENIATQYLFQLTPLQVPVWMFNLCVELAKKGDSLSEQKISKIFKVDFGTMVVSQWKAEIIADLNTEDS
jgi:hypothetical protein